MYIAWLRLAEMHACITPVAHFAPDNNLDCRSGVIGWSHHLDDG
jgi:hypothetical protein